MIQYQLRSLESEICLRERVAKLCVTGPRRSKRIIFDYIILCIFNINDGSAEYRTIHQANNIQKAHELIVKTIIHVHWKLLTDAYKSRSGDSDIFTNTLYLAINLIKFF